MAQWMVWAFASAIMLVLFMRDLLTFDHGAILGGDFWGRDFINMWTGGQLVRSGRVDVLLNFHSYVDYQRSLFGQIDPHNYSYPPVTYPLAALISVLPYWAALLAWLGGTGTLFAYACRRWWPTAAGPFWLAALTPAALLTVWDGQYGFLIGSLYLLGWQWLDEHPQRAGVAFGLMLLKPHLAFLIPIVLLARRDWMAIASAALTVVLLVAGSVLCFGWEPWFDFLFRTGAAQASMINAGHTFYSFLATSTATAVMQFGVGWTVGLLVHAVIATAAIALVCIAALRKIPTRDLAFLTATGTFLVLPYAFNYDLTVVCVGAVVLMNSAVVSDLEYKAACYGFMCPVLGMMAAVVGLPLMPVMLIALAVAQFHCWVMRGTRLTAVQLPASLRGLVSPQHS